MSLLIFEKKFTLTNGMFDEYYGIKPYAILDIFQRIAGDHADLLGCGTEFCNKNNYAWIIVRQEVYIYNNPTPMETVLVKTFPHLPSRVECKREYEISSPNGTIYAKGCASWVLVDLSTFKMLKSTNIYPEGEFLESVLFKEKLLKPLNVLEEENYLCDYLVVKSDIDIYHHMNNAKYAELLFDYCDLKAIEIDHFAINYINQIKQNMKMKIYKKCIDNHTYITGECDGTLIFTSVVDKKNKEV